MGKKTNLIPNEHRVRNVLLSSTIRDNEQMLKYRQGVINQLSHNFYVRNANGEIGFNLHTLEDKIVRDAHAHLFLPIPKLSGTIKIREAVPFFKELFKAASLIVGKQTNDPLLWMDSSNNKSPHKPMVLVNKDGCWQPFIDLLHHMHDIGAVTQDPKKLYHEVENIDKAIDYLQAFPRNAPQKAQASHHHDSKYTEKDILDKQADPDQKNRPDFNVCVYCSASSKNPDLLKIARYTGSRIAEKGWGTISGLGSVSMMGELIKGAHSKNGWIAGSNLERIMKSETLPEYYDKIWLAKDIYERMYHMTKQSDAFMILPGGMGTIQELMALLIMKYPSKEDKVTDEQKKLMEGKPIVVLNAKITLSDGRQFKYWDPLIKLAKTYGFKQNDLRVVDTVGEAISFLEGYQYKHTQQHAASR